MLLVWSVVGVVADGWCDSVKVLVVLLVRMVTVQTSNDSDDSH
jgi:hypothetical protein